MLTWSLGCTGVLLPELAAQQLDRAVGDDLVDVHVGLGPRAGLPHVERELSSRSPAMTSSATRTIRSAFQWGSRPAGR